jgi:hypothetical protein
MLEKGSVKVQLGPVPPGWSRIQLEGADLAYRDPAAAGSAMVDFRCKEADIDAPLTVLTQQLIMGTTERDVVSEETIPFDGREALHTVMRAKLDGVPLQYDIFVMKKDECVYDLVYLAPPDRYEQGAAAFERFARGLHAAAAPVNVVGTAGTSKGSDP